MLNLNDNNSGSPRGPSSNRKGFWKGVKSLGTSKKNSKKGRGDRFDSSPLAMDDIEFSNNDIDEKSSKKGKAKSRVNSSSVVEPKRTGV